MPVRLYNGLGISGRLSTRKAFVHCTNGILPSRTHFLQFYAGLVSGGELGFTVIHPVSRRVRKEASLRGS
jgi:hypothetical protein